METKERSIRAFALVELLVVVSTIALLAAISMPTLARVREVGRRAACKANVSAISSAMGLYICGNGNDWPWFLSPEEARGAYPHTSYLQWFGSGMSTEGLGGTFSPTSYNRGGLYNCGNYNVSALLFALVRSGQNPEIFNCPSTTDTPDPNAKDNNGNYFWDFSPYRWGNAEHVSYSYQFPLMVDANGGQQGIIVGYSSGVTQFSNPQLPVLSDRNPLYERFYNGATTIGGTPVGGVACTDPTNPYGAYLLDWSNLGTNDKRAGMSQNHSSGEMMNVMYADLHVADAERADIGLNKDNIFTASGGDPNIPGSPKGVCWGSSNVRPRQGKSEDGSFLVGPDRKK